MNPSQEEFIRKNRHKLSVRQMAKRLGIDRSEVEKFLHARPAQDQPPAEKELSKFREFSSVAGIFTLAFFLRVLYIHWLRATPFFEPLSLKLDDGVYHEMAKAISQGNWLGDLPFSAYRMPLYPYILAVLYRIFGPSITLVHYVQSLVGALSAICIYALTKEVFRIDRAALIAGVIAAIYIPFIFFENLLLGETFSIFFNVLSLWVLVRAFREEEERFIRVSVSGLLLGLSTLLRPNTIMAALFLFVFLIYLEQTSGKKWVKAFILPAVFILFIGLVITPSAVRNFKLHKDFVPLSALGGVNLYIGNNPEANGKFTLTKGIGTSLETMLNNSIDTAEKNAGHKLKPSEVSSYWTSRAFDFIGSSPGTFSKLIFLKSSYFFNQYEFPDILDIAFVGQFIPFLNLHRGLYGALVVLGLFGGYLSLKQKRKAAFLPAVFFVGYSASVILFFVSARYRLPAVPVLIVFASFAIHEVLRSIRSQPMMLTEVVSIGVLLSLLAFRPVETTNFTTNYNSLAIALKNKGRFTEAEKYYLKSIEIAPEYPSPYYNLALMLSQNGRTAEADVYYKKFDTLRGNQD